MFHIPEDAFSKAVLKKSLCLFMVTCFILTGVVPVSYAQAVFNLPQPGEMVGLSEAFLPVVLKGVSIHPENPLLFDFIVDNGHSKLDGQALTDETTKLVKYFLAGLAVPEKDLWVNLSPKEQDRIMTDDLSHTDVGRDMLTQDYILKQITSTLMYPEKALGRKFWDEVYQRTYQKFGSTDVPVDSFNKVWITPAESTVYQNGNNAFIAGAHLKVMLESDYQAAAHISSLPETLSPNTELTKQIIREIILPVLEKEINEGKNFATLRQVFQSMILAGWYKNVLKTSILNQVYSNSNKVNGIDIPQKDAREQVYAQYMAAYQKGVYNYIKDEFDQNTQGTLPRKYFAGGVKDLSQAPALTTDSRKVTFAGTVKKIVYKMWPAKAREAMANITPAQQQALQQSLGMFDHNARLKDIKAALQMAGLRDVHSVLPMVLGDVVSQVIDEDRVIKGASEIKRLLASRATIDRVVFNDGSAMGILLREPVVDYVFVENFAEIDVSLQGLQKKDPRFYAKEILRSFLSVVDRLKGTRILDKHDNFILYELLNAMRDTEILVARIFPDPENPGSLKLDFPDKGDKAQTITQREFEELIPVLRAFDKNTKPEYIGRALEETVKLGEVKEVRLITSDDMIPSFLFTGDGLLLGPDHLNDQGKDVSIFKVTLGDYRLMWVGLRDPLIPYVLVNKNSARIDISPKRRKGMTTEQYENELSRTFQCVIATIMKGDLTYNLNASLNQDGKLSELISAAQDKKYRTATIIFNEGNSFVKENSRITDIKFSDPVMSGDDSQQVLLDKDYFTGLILLGHGAQSGRANGDGFVTSYSFLGRDSIKWELIQVNKVGTEETSFQLKKVSDGRVALTYVDRVGKIDDRNGNKNIMARLVQAVQEGQAVKVAEEAPVWEVPEVGKSVEAKDVRQLVHDLLQDLGAKMRLPWQGNAKELLPSVEFSIAHPDDMELAGSILRSKGLKVSVNGQVISVGFVVKAKNTRENQASLYDHIVGALVKALDEDFRERKLLADGLLGNVRLATDLTWGRMQRNKADSTVIDGGIDLGQTDYLKVIATDAAGLPQFDPAQIRRLQKDLRGLVPVPVGLPQAVNVSALLN